MDAATLLPLLVSCAPLVAPATAHALIKVESGLNPYAIGVVGDALVRQPHSHAEALATMRQLRVHGRDFSVGLAQINQRNFARLGLTPAAALHPCPNLRAMQAVLSDCLVRSPRAQQPQQAVRDALSCYYSGNYGTGYRHGYVQRVVAASRALAQPAPSLPAPPF
jgi:type IV secretion system protein VirB1